MFTNTLSKGTQDALAILGDSKVLPRDSYLAGGTALALHLGHRISVDFDFFTSVVFDSDKVVRTLRQVGTFNLERFAENTVLGTFNHVRFSLFTYQYPLIFKTIPYLKIDLANPRDIGAMKIAAISTRGTKKDFFDLFKLAEVGITIDNCLKYYEKKYKSFANNTYTIISALSYFAEAEESADPQMIDKISWEEVKSFFEKEAIKLGQKYL